MGQSSSSFPNETNDIYKKSDIYELNDKELKHLLVNSRPLSLVEIMTASRDVIKKNKNKNSTNSEESNSGFYSLEDDSILTQLARRILQVEPKDNVIIGKARFKLVPSKLKEPIFWLSTISLLQERLADIKQYKQSQQIQAEESDNDDDDAEVVVTDEQDTVDDDEDDDDEDSDDDDDSDDDNYLHGNNTDDGYVEDNESDGDAEAEINHLKQQVKFLKNQVNNLRRKNTKLTTQLELASASSTKAKLDPTVYHVNGTWIVDKDSKEFLNYPEELKQNMRNEKMKRLESVKKEMKFILDSDNIEDTNGYWSCCHSTSYYPEHDSKLQHIGTNGANGNKTALIMKTTCNGGKNKNNKF